MIVSDDRRFPLPQVPFDFSFDEDSHTYTVTTSAIGRVPGCTRVLDHGGLVNFDFVNRDILERKSELGREVHKACHLHNQKKAFTFDPAVRGYLESWIATARALRLVVRQSEHQSIALVHGMLYGMQIDVEGELPEGDAIIDYKIGDIAPHHEIQVAGYAAGLYHPRLETPLGRFRTRKRIIVKLQEDGSLGKIHRC